LREHLLVLKYLQETSLTLPGGQNTPWYSPVRDGWIPPSHLRDYLIEPMSLRQVVQEQLRKRLTQFVPYRLADGATASDLYTLAARSFLERLEEQLPTVDLVRFSRD